MTPKAFRDTLRAVSKDNDYTARQRADEAFARHTPQEWTQATLDHWPGELARQRLLFWLVFGLIALVPVGKLALDREFSPWLIGLALFNGLLVGLGVSLRTFGNTLSVTPLLGRLDDPRLVPLWLENLPPEKSPLRPVFLERIGRHLPAWRASGQTLSGDARYFLEREVRQLLGAEALTEADIAFLTAALDSLADAPVDRKTTAVLAAHADRGDERVRAAVAGAVQRLGLR